MISKHFILATALTGAAAITVAEPLPSPIQFLESRGAEIVGTFDAPGGLKGYAARFRGEPLGIYLTADGEHAIVGTLLNDKGEEVSRKHLERLVAASPAQVDWEALGKADWVAEGDLNTERVVYAFMDPNCPYCAMFWQAAQPYLKKGGVQLRHIMVGVLRPDSLPKAATILASENPAATLAKHQRTLKNGGISPQDNLPESVTQKVIENSQLMHANNIYATPAIVYKDATGAIRLVQGVPSTEVMQEQIFPDSP